MTHFKHTQYHKYRSWRRIASAVLFYTVVIIGIALWLFVSTLEFNGIV